MNPSESTRDNGESDGELHEASEGGMQESPMVSVTTSVHDGGGDSITPIVSQEEALNVAVDFMQLLDDGGQANDSLDFADLLPERALTPPIDLLRGMLRRAIRARAGSFDIRASPLATTRSHFEFRLVAGQWITSRAYSLFVGDDDADVRFLVASALTDLLDDMMRYPAV
jgi:hypothetical protein